MKTGLCLVLIIFITIFPPPVISAAQDHGELLLDVSISKCNLTVYELNNGSPSLIKTYPAATVKTSRQVWKPLGQARITRIEMNPSWHPTAYTREYFQQKKGIILPKTVKPNDKLNYMGAVKMDLSFIGPRGAIYRIHGTNEPGSIGRRVTGGCIRLKNEDALELAGMIHVGTRVYVHE